MTQEPQVPPSVASDGKGCELVRAWAAHGGLVGSLNTGPWPQDEGAVAWGIRLSDIARHVAGALYQTHGLDRATGLARMGGVFDSELERPSAEAKGKFV